MRTFYVLFYQSWSDFSIIKPIFIFILFENTIKLPADTLIVVEFFLIIFQNPILQNKNPILQNKICSWEIENRPIFRGVFLRFFSFWWRELDFTPITEVVKLIKIQISWMIVIVLFLCFVLFIPIDFSIL